MGVRVYLMGVPLMCLSHGRASHGLASQRPASHKPASHRPASQRRGSLMGIYLIGLPLIPLTAKSTFSRLGGSRLLHPYWFRDFQGVTPLKSVLRGASRVA